MQFYYTRAGRCGVDDDCGAVAKYIEGCDTTISPQRKELTKVSQRIMSGELVEPGAKLN